MVLRLQQKPQPNSGSTTKRRMLSTLSARAELRRLRLAAGIMVVARTTIAQGVSIHPCWSMKSVTTGIVAYSPW